MSISNRNNASEFGKGALTKPLSRKDYRLELLASAPDLPAEYDINFNGKVKNQGRSLSCVAQGLTYYAEYLNFLETGQWVALSARDLYSKIYEPQGGAYVDNGLESLMNDGVCSEESAPSYFPNGNPPSDEFMRKREDITPEEQETAHQYMIKKYLTWNNKSTYWYKQAIIQGHGAVAISSGNNILWNDAIIEIPAYKSQMDWLHLVFFVGWSDKKKSFKILNSWNGWGEQGFGWLPYAYIEKGYVTNPKTMIDIPNNTYIKLMSQYKNLLQLIVELLQAKIKKILGIK